jgi:glycogen(starch) synthase
VKILFISNLYPPNIVGGYERLCFAVAEGLAKRGHQVMVLTSDYGGKKMDYPGQVVCRDLSLFATKDNIYKPFSLAPDEWAARDIYNQEVITKVTAKYEPHVLFVWNLSFLTSSILEAIKKTELSVVYLLTDNWLASFLNPAFVQEYFAKRVLNFVPKYQLLYLGVKRKLKKRGTAAFLLPGRAIFASRFMREFYSEAGFHFEGDTVIYHGVNLPVVDEARFANRNKLVTDGELRLLIAGRVVDLKGVHTAIQALPSIQNKLSSLKVTLTVVGDDQDHAYLERIHSQISNMHLSGVVKFDKPVPEDGLFDLFQQYDIYLFPSLYEPFSLTLIHALNAGIPTIASDAGGNPEIVGRRQAGLLFPRGNDGRLAEAVVRLGRNEVLREALSFNARHISHEYTFERMLTEIDQYLGIKI